MCGLWGLGAFTLHHVFEGHPCCTRRQRFIPFYAGVTLQPVAVTHFLSTQQLMDT